LGRSGGNKIAGFITSFLSGLDVESASNHLQKKTSADYLRLEFIERFRSVKLVRQPRMGKNWRDTNRFGIMRVPIKTSSGKPSRRFGILAANWEQMRLAQTSLL